MVYGAIRPPLGLRLSQEEEFEGADLSIHKDPLDARAQIELVGRSGGIPASRRPPTRAAFSFRPDEVDKSARAAPARATSHNPFMFTTRLLSSCDR